MLPCRYYLAEKNLCRKEKETGLQDKARKLCSLFGPDMVRFGQESLQLRMADFSAHSTGVFLVIARALGTSKLESITVKPDKYWGYGEGGRHWDKPLNSYIALIQKKSARNMLPLTQAFLNSIYFPDQ